MKVKRWSRPAYAAFSLLFIAIMCFTLLPSVQIGNFSLGGAGVASASTNYVETFTTAGTFYWICPAGVTSVQVEVRGGGGGGGKPVANFYGAGGGGGGAYAKITGYAVTPGGNYTYVVGVGGAIIGGAGGDSYFGNTTTVKAAGGSGGTAGGGGAGGTTANSVGSTEFAGGAGGGVGAWVQGCGGGGAGDAANGSDGTTAAGQGGGAGGTSGGGRGGDQSEAGDAPGGGGCGGFRWDGVGWEEGFVGGVGRVVLTYTSTYDQITLQSTGVKDTYLGQGVPTTNNGISNSLNVVSETGSKNIRSILGFTHTIPQNSIISSAILSIDYYSFAYLSPNPVGRTYWAYRVLRTDWNEAQATWNIYKTGGNWTTAGCSGNGTDYTTTNGVSTTVPASFGWMNWTVTAQVQTAVTAGTALEFLIKDGTEDAAYIGSASYSNDWTTASERPKLVITYLVPLTITTLAATDITATSATLNGNITSLIEGGNVTQYGFVLSTTTQSNPGNVSPSAQTTYTAGNWTYTAPGGGYAAGQTFDSNGNVTGLSEDTCYYFRAAGYNTYGWVYGNEQSLLTEPSALGLPTGYEYTVPLTVTNTSGSTLTNYPVRVPVRKGVNPIVTVSPKQSLNGGSYGYYIPMTVTEYSNTTLTNYQFKMDVDTAWLVTNGYSTVSGTCVRWTDNSNNLLNFWLETSGAAAGWNAANTYYWVMGNVTALGNTTIRMWFDPSTGNTTLASSMANTFPTFFDDFDDASIDGAKWTYTADATETGGQIQVGNATAIAHDFTSIASPLAVNTRLRFSGYMSSTGTTDNRIGSVKGGNNTFFFYYSLVGANLYAAYYDDATTVDLGFALSDANHIWEIDKAGSETDSGMSTFQIDLQTKFSPSTVIGTAPVYKTPAGKECPGSTKIAGYADTANTYTRMQWVFVSQYVAREPVVTYFPFGDPQAFFLQEHPLSWPYDITFYRADRETPIPFWRDPETQFVSSNDYCVDYWAQVPAIPTSNNATIWMAYGKTGESDQSNGETTFEYFNPGNETTSLTSVSGTWVTETQQKPLFYGIYPHQTRAPALIPYDGGWVSVNGFNELMPAVSLQGENPYPYQFLVFKSPDLTTWADLPTIPFYVTGNWVDFRGAWGNGLTTDGSGTYYIPIVGGGVNPYGAMGIVSTTDFETYSVYSGNPVITSGAGGFPAAVYDYFLFYDSATSQWIAIANDGDKFYWGNSSSVYGAYTERSDLLNPSIFAEGPSIVKEGSTYYLYYTGGGIGTPNQNIYYATCNSPPPWDAVSFTYQGLISLTAYEWDYSSQATACIVWDSANSRWIMSFSGYAAAGMATTNIAQDALIGWATSPNLTGGGSWTLQNTQTEIKQSNTAAAYKIATIGNYTNYAIAAEVNIKNPSAAGQYAGFVMGYDNSTSFYNALLYNSDNFSTGTLLMQKYTGSATTLSNTATVVPIVPGNRMRLEAKNVSGNMTINYSKWGVKWNATAWNYDTSLSGQGVGLVTYASGADYANIRIRPCVNPEPTIIVGGVETSTTPNISNTPSSWSVGVVQPSQTYWANGVEPGWPLSAGDCWGNLTNNSSFAVDISASMTNMLGGTTWSIGASPSTNVFVLKIGVVGTANIGNFTTLSNTPVAWIISMAAGNMTRWTMVFYTPTNTPQFADGVTKNGNLTFEAEPS